MPQPFAVAAFYQFAPMADCGAVATLVDAACRSGGVRGTVLVAPEGINGTIAGPAAGIAAALEAVRRLPGCADVRIKHATAAGMPFHRLKVRIKAEIVTMGEPGIDPLAAGRHVDPADWNALIAEPGTLLIDTRNSYEVAVGSFAGAIDPGTRSFAEFPAWVRARRDALIAAPRVAMFCTGGIRCEKASALLMAEGIEAVFHLRGGVLDYLAAIPAEDSRWQGECFVFDERVAVGQGLAAGSHVLCRACRMPVSEAGRASPQYVEGVSCAACHDTRGEGQRAGYAERHRQARLAQARGIEHIGARLAGR